MLIHAHRWFMVRSGDSYESAHDSPVEEDWLKRYSCVSFDNNKGYKSSPYFLVPVIINNNNIIIYWRLSEYCWIISETK